MFVLYGLSEKLTERREVREIEEAVIASAWRFLEKQREKLRESEQEIPEGDDLLDSSLRFKMASFRRVKDVDCLIIRSEGWGMEQLPNSLVASATDSLMEGFASAERRTVFNCCINLLRYSYWLWRLREMRRCERSYSEADFKQVISDLNLSRRYLERGLAALRKQIKAKPTQKRRAAA